MEYLFGQLRSALLVVSPHLPTSSLFSDGAEWETKKVSILGKHYSAIAKISRCYQHWFCRKTQVIWASVMKTNPTPAKPSTFSTPYSIPFTLFLGLTVFNTFTTAAALFSLSFDICIDNIPLVYRTSPFKHPFKFPFSSFSPLLGLHLLQRPFRAVNEISFIIFEYVSRVHQPHIAVL